MESTLEVCASVSERVPVVLMVYSNMVLAHGGAAEFARRAAAAGAAGAIVPDLPLDEADEIREALSGAGLALVPLLAPTTPPERRARICAAAQGFVYVVSTVGTTGERQQLPAGLAELVAATKAEAEVPVAVGFGIGTPEQVAEVGEIADGVIVGSRLVRAAGEAGSAAGRGRGGRPSSCATPSLRSPRRPVLRLGFRRMGLVVSLFLALAATTVGYAWLGQGGGVAGLIFFDDPADRRHDPRLQAQRLRSPVKQIRTHRAAWRALHASVRGRPDLLDRRPQARVAITSRYSASSTSARSPAVFACSR